MHQVRFSGLLSFFLTTLSVVDRLDFVGRLSRVSAADAAPVAPDAIRSLPVLRQSKISFCSLVACVICAASCFLAGPSWAAPTAISQQIAEEFDRHLITSQITEDSHGMAEDAPLLIGAVDDSISQTPAAQVPVDLLVEPEESERKFQPIPEPSSLALLGGLGGLMFFIHRLRAYFDRSAA